MNPPPHPGTDPFAVLRQFVRPRRDVERCELCSQEISAEHPHLLELTPRRIVCSCNACAVLFSGQEAARFRRIPQEVQALTDFRLSDARWDSLAVPIDLAFFFSDSRSEKIVAHYPAPAGLIEALLPFDAWPELVADNPVLSELMPDVEALLVNRIEGRRDYFRVPIDECYKLVGLIRRHWRGLSGGEEVWSAVKRFFAGLRERAGAGGRTHA